MSSPSIESSNSWQFLAHSPNEFIAVRTVLIGKEEHKITIKSESTMELKQRVEKIDSLFKRFPQDHVQLTALLKHEITLGNFTMSKQSHRIKSASEPISPRGFARGGVTRPRSGAIIQDMDEKKSASVRGLEKEKVSGQLIELRREVRTVAMDLEALFNRLDEIEIIQNKIKLPENEMTVDVMRLLNGYEKLEKLSNPEDRIDQQNKLDAIYKNKTFTDKEREIFHMLKENPALLKERNELKETIQLRKHSLEKAMKELDVSISKALGNVSIREIDAAGDVFNLGDEVLKKAA